MIFAGLLKDLGKIVVGNIIKSAGKEIISHGKKKSVKNFAFDKILLAEVNLKNSDNVNTQHKNIKSKIIKKLEKLKVEVLKKKLPEKSKLNILKKIDKIIDILSGIDNQTFQKLLNENSNIINDFKSLQVDNKNFNFNNRINSDKLIVKKLSQEFAELKKLLTMAFSQKNIFKNSKNFNEFSSNTLKKNNLNKEINANNFKKLSEINSNKYVKNVSVKQTKIKNKDDFLKTAKLILKHLENKKVNKEFLTDKFKKLNEMENNMFINKDKGDKFEKIIEFKAGKEKLSGAQQEMRKVNFDKKDNINSFFQKFSNSNDVNKINFKNIKSEEIISKKMDFENNIIEQIKAKFQNNIKNEMTIKLHPPELGKIHIKLVALNHDLTAKITTENHLVKNAIINNFQTLQDSLNEKGINLSNFQVNVQGEFAENNDKKQNKFEKSKNSFTSVNIEDENEEYFEILNLIDEITNNLNLKA